jgi:hypothetical protein
MAKEDKGMGKASAEKERSCALCQQVRPLRDSHIIPEFLHGPLYDEKHRFNTYGLDGRPATGLEQKGERERLLCDECEQRFCGYERWASDFYRGAIAAFDQVAHSVFTLGKAMRFIRIDAEGKPTTSAVPKIINVEGFDYTKMKLFLLSLLWRMGVSKLHFFSGVTLGFHEKRIRKMLLNGDPGATDQYACQLRLIELEGKLVTDYQSQPRQYDWFGKKRCRFFSTGFRFDFTVSNHPVDEQSMELFCVKPQSHYPCWVDSLRTHPDLANELIRFGTEMKWIEPPITQQSKGSSTR